EIFLDRLRARRADSVTIVQRATGRQSEAQDGNKNAKLLHAPRFNCSRILAKSFLTCWMCASANVVARNDRPMLTTSRTVVTDNTSGVTGPVETPRKKSTDRSPARCGHNKFRFMFVTPPQSG